MAPDVWSAWKGNLLSLLFKKANTLFLTKPVKEKTSLIKKTKKDTVFKEVEESKFKKIVGSSFSTYFNTYNEEELIYQIGILLNQTKDISLKVKYSQKNSIDQLTIWSKKQEVGFAEICGKLSSASINIYSGRITVLKKNLSLYTFEVNRFGKSTFNQKCKKVETQKYASIIPLCCSHFVDVSTIFTKIVSFFVFFIDSNQ